MPIAVGGGKAGFEPTNSQNCCISKMATNTLNQ
jgi:hypothetical protein